MNNKKCKETIQDWLGLPGPIKDPSHEFIMTVMLASRMLSTAGRQLLSNSGLTEAQFNILMLLRYQFAGGSTQVGLSRCMLVNRANITGLVDRLERDGLVARRSKKGDRRIKIVTLTPRGADNLSIAESLYFGGIKKVSKGIPETDQQAAEEILLRLCRLVHENISPEKGGVEQ